MSGRALAGVASPAVSAAAMDQVVTELWLLEP